MTDKKYYTVEELDSDINNFIEESADDLILKLREKKKNQKVSFKEEVYV